MPEHGRERSTRIGGAHEGLADQEGVHVGRTHPLDVFPLENAALGHDRDPRRHLPQRIEAIMF